MSKNNTSDKSSHSDERTYTTLLSNNGKYSDLTPHLIWCLSSCCRIFSFSVLSNWRNVGFWKADQSRAHVSAGNFGDLFWTLAQGTNDRRFSAQRQSGCSESAWSTTATVGSNGEKRGQCTSKQHVGRSIYQLSVALPQPG